METRQRFKLRYTALATLCAGLTACGGGSSSTAFDDSDPNAPVLEDAEARIDRVRPTLSITSPASTGTIATRSKSVTLSGVAKDNRQVARVTWVTDTGASGRATQSAASDQVSWSSGAIVLAEGSSRITVRAYDRAGNVASQVVTVAVAASTAAPAPVATAPAASPSPAAPSPVASPAPAAPAPTPVASPAPAAPAPTPVASPAPATTSTPTTTSSNLAYIDTSIALPRGSAGSSTSDLAFTGEMGYADPDGTGAFRNVCQFSHMNYDDALVFPNQPGAAHLHAYFGNTGANASSTAASIKNSGNSTCRGGTVNRSAYWVPAVISSAGRPIAPSHAHVYYKTGYQGVRNDQVTVIPDGLRMIAGNSKSQTPQDVMGAGCGGVDGNIRTIPVCTAGNELWLSVHFPQCWDGVNLDSPDHRSHMAYGTWGVGCPSSHPVAIPEISIIAVYVVPSGTTSAGWRLSSDVNGSPAGSSAHADWINGWQTGIPEVWTRQLLNRGLSGGSHMLGDGRVMLGSF